MFIVLIYCNQSWQHKLLLHYLITADGWNNGITKTCHNLFLLHQNIRVVYWPWPYHENFACPPPYHFLSSRQRNSWGERWRSHSLSGNWAKVWVSLRIRSPNCSVSFLVLPTIASSDNWEKKKQIYWLNFFFKSFWFYDILI